ncbi:TPA: 3'-5' exoribonuclease, partial [Salmonella enterica subsp. salamae]
VMIDIETTGTGHHSAIASAAAAVFNPLTGEIFAEEYVKFNWKEGRYESASEEITGAVAELQRLESELRDIIEIHRYEK